MKSNAVVTLDFVGKNRGGHLPTECAAEQNIELAMGLIFASSAVHLGEWRAGIGWLLRGVNFDQSDTSPAALACFDRGIETRWQHGHDGCLGRVDRGQVKRL